MKETFLNGKRFYRRALKHSAPLKRIKFYLFSSLINILFHFISDNQIKRLRRCFVEGHPEAATSEWDLILADDDSS